MKKPKKESVPTSIRLAREDYDRLRGMEGGVPAGLKRGLDLLKIEEGADEPTRELARLVIELAREVELELGVQWHANGVAHRTFRRMLLRAISKWRPTDYNDNILVEVRLPPLRERPLASVPVNDADSLGVALTDRVLEEPDRTVRDRMRSASRETLQEIENSRQPEGRRQ